MIDFAIGAAVALSSLQLEAFLAVSQTLNFTKAADSLHITQSALSQRIANLEDNLDTTLFIRDRAGLKLTEAAHSLVRYCQLKNQHEDEFIAGLRTRVSGELAGVFRVGGFSSVMRSVFLPAISSLFEKHRGLKLQMMIRELNELPDLLKRGEIDYMILDKKIEREDIECVFLGHEENVLVEKRGYSGPDIYLDHEEADDITFTYFRKFETKLKNPRRLYLDDVYGLIDGVKLGLGRAVVPLHMIEHERSIEVLSPKQVLKTPVYLCFYKQPYYTRLHEVVVESITKSGALAR